MSITSNYLSSDINLKSEYGVTNENKIIPASLNNSIAGLTLIPRSIEGKGYKNLK
jgi:hypothetical protein